jgi:prophage tail gpP-like protein
VASDNVWLLGAKHVLDKAEDAQVKGFSWASDTSSLFYKYSYVSELAATDLKGNKLKGKNGKTTTISGSNVDVRVRKQRMSCVNIKVEKDKLLAAKKNKYRMSHAVATEKSMSVDIYDFAHYHSKKIFYIGDYLDYVNDTLGVDGIFLISDITYSFSLTEGHTAKLTLADPKAYIPEPPDEITKAQRRRKKQQTKKVKEKDKKKGAITYGKTTLENLMGSK